jgi:hypothetical protein
MTTFIDIPEITPEDEIFACKVLKQYKIPIDSLHLLIRYVRYYLTEWKEEWKEDFILQDDFLKIFGPTDEIKEIIIKTDKETVKIKYPDLLFNWCLISIKRLKFRFKKQIKSSNNFIRSHEQSLLLDLILSGLTETLNKFQQRVVIGMFLVYFKIGNPLMTEQEFELKRKESLTETQDYKHYLSDIVKSRLKKIQEIL